MKHSNFVNIVNFIRALEPRYHEQRDLFEPVREQMALAKEFNLPTTWLLQYDALTTGPFVDFLKNEMPESHEIGIWFEVVQPNVEAAGIPWRGRWAWDWHTDVGFSVGYSPEERERIADVFVERFRETFGRRPASMGSWLFDAHLLAYLYRRYRLEAACNCKDQYGTDGYTLWGGYWANGYYPSIQNAYLPAQHPESQIPVPVFRMLGSDPLYQYSAGIAGNGQQVITLEPAFEGLGGGSREWVDWFFRENYRHPHLAMAYAQAGQENSFGWDRMKKGLPGQYREIARLRDAGTIRIATLGETGRWFRSHFPVTPASAVVTLDDWQQAGHAGVWYLSRFGRVNLFRETDGTLTVRDWQLFREDYAEPYLRDVCHSGACVYDALPLLDGMLWHPSSFRFPGGPGEVADVLEESPEILRIVWKRKTGEHVVIRLTPETMAMEFPRDGEALFYQCNRQAVELRTPTALFFRNGQIRYRHKGYDYGFGAEVGRIVPDGDDFRLEADGRHLVLRSF